MTEQFRLRDERELRKAGGGGGGGSSGGGADEAKMMRMMNEGFRDFKVEQVTSNHSRPSTWRSRTARCSARSPRRRR